MEMQHICGELHNLSKVMANTYVITMVIHIMIIFLAEIK